MTRTLIAAALAISASTAIAAAQETKSDSAANTGTLIVLNKSAASASLIDLATQAEVVKIPLGVGPHEVAVSQDGRTAVVCNYGTQTPGSSLTVIDLAHEDGAKAVRTIDLPGYTRPHGIEYLADGTHVAVTCESQQALIVVNIEQGTIAHAIETTQRASHMVKLSPDTTRAYVSNIASGSVSVIDLKENKLLKVIECAPGSEGLDLSPDGKELWVGNRQVHTLTIIDTDKLEVIASLESERFPIRLKFTPDGKHVLVSNAQSGDVAIFDAKERTEIRRIEMKATPVEEKDGRMFQDQFGNGPIPIGLLISADGSRAYVANTNADIITIIDLKTHEIVGRLVTGKEPDGLGWTPLKVKASSNPTEKVSDTGV